MADNNENNTQNTPATGGSTTPEAQAQPRNEVLETEHGTTVIAFVEDPTGYKVELIERS